MATTHAPNPKDSMKSTWREDRSQWYYPHYTLSQVRLYQQTPDKPFPVFSSTDPIPYLSDLSCHAWIILHAAWPMFLQIIYLGLVGNNLHPIATFFLYWTAFRLNGFHQTKAFNKIASRCGFFDGEKHARDDVPDIGVGKVWLSIQLTTSVRAFFTTYLTYKKSQAPNLSWWLPIELCLYAVILDFWFYIYHRSCHEIDFLWKYHRTHHLTKHPNPLLSAYADAEQEILEIAVIPLLTWGALKLLGLPMGFYDWWICHQYLIFTEAFGHSGLRIYSTPPGIASPILKLFGCELIIEDHDLHHRRGWRKSSNYGKQTRLWDSLFGSCGTRIESDVANVDLSQKINMPLF